MEQKKSLFEILDEIVKHDNRYEMEGYNFVLLAFNYTSNKLKLSGHISGKELLGGIKDYALEQYGPMARIVLEHWGITKSSDFGDIVFNLVEFGLLGKSENDSKDDFKGGLDFEEAFDKPFKL